MISEQQLEIWSHQGDTRSSAYTVESITNTISSVLENKIKTYLQGSYKNSTNIRGDSDVDIVIEAKEAFYYDLGYLNENEKSLFSRHFTNSQSNWVNFRKNITDILQRHYGYVNVILGDKSIKIADVGNRVPADVVVCYEFRKYFTFSEEKAEDYLPGIVFWSIDTNERIINYPDLHYFHGVKKNNDDNTKGLYKPMIRVFKNARTYAFEHNFIPDHTPSYFIECLLSNIPNENFVPSLETSFLNILKTALSLDLEKIKCQNNISLLVGNGSTQWKLLDAQKFLVNFANFFLEN